MRNMSTASNVQQATEHVTHAPTPCPSRLPWQVDWPVKTAVRHTPLMQQGHFKTDPKPSTLPSKEAHAA